MSWHYNFKGFVLLLVILATLLFLSSAGLAQYPSFDWAKASGGSGSDCANDIAIDNSGNLFVVGSFSSTMKIDEITLTSNGYSDIFIVKYDKFGNVQWAHGSGGSYADEGHKVAIDQLGNCIITGFFYGTMTFGHYTLTSAGGWDAFIAKFNVSGDVLWAKNVGGLDIDRGYGVTTDHTNNIIVVGYFRNIIKIGNNTLFSAGDYDVFIAKYNAVGDVLWAKQAGGTSVDQALDVSIDDSDDIIVTGKFTGIAKFGSVEITSSGSDDIFIAKYNPSGNILWAKQEGGNYSDAGYGVASDAAGNIFVTGVFNGNVMFGSNHLVSNGKSDMFVAKYNASGSLLWVKQGFGPEWDEGKGIATDESGNCLITGILTPFGSAYDIFAAKFDSDGNLAWVKQAKGELWDQGLGIATNQIGESFITGCFEGEIYFDSIKFKSHGHTDIFISKIIELPLLAEFSAIPTEGIAPLTVKFTDLSKGQITSWLWDFGDGTTSTQQNPIHIYDPQIDPKFTVSLTVTGPEGTDTETKVDYITVYLPVIADFDADRTVGPAPIEVHFKNLTTGSADTYEWSFGDHCYSKEFEPSKLYDEAGIYHVSLKASGPGGSDIEYREGFITIYADSGYLHLSFVKGSAAYPEEPWNNAIDGDTWGWDGTATVEGDTTYAIFEFKNQALKKVNRFRLMTDTGVHFKDRWVTAFRVQVSTTGMLPADFTTVLDTIKTEGAWQYFKIAPVDAKYVKLIIDEPIQGWRQVGEFEVWEYLNLPDPMLSTITATTPHFSTGVDPSKITLKLLDEYGAPVAGKAGKIQLHATGSDNHFGNIIETANPGSYTATLTTMVAELKTIKAVVQGVAIKYSDPDSEKLCTVEFVEPPSVLTKLELVKNSFAYPGEGWDNAIDGDIKGWDGTVTATGWPPFAIFKFADNTIHAIHKIRLMTDTGVRYSDRWVTDFRVFVSTTGTAEIDFKLILTGHQTTGNWQNYFFTQTDAKYIKLVIDQPTDTWRQLGEFEVYEVESVGPVLAEHFVATNNRANSTLSPDQFALLQNYPNPFNPETTIRYDLADHARVTIVVYNINGQEVKRLIDQAENAGRYLVAWDGTDNFGGQATAGVYLYRITAEFKDRLFSDTKRMILLR